jgi:hypothetical protein
MITFRCIKGLAIEAGVVVMQNDGVQFLSSGEGGILVIGISGWCDGIELTFTPTQFVTHFEIIY